MILLCSWGNSELTSVIIWMALSDPNPFRVGGEYSITGVVDSPLGLVISSWWPFGPIQFNSAKPPSPSKFRRRPQMRPQIFLEFCGITSAPTKGQLRPVWLPKLDSPKNFDPPQITLLVSYSIPPKNIRHHVHEAPNSFLGTPPNTSQNYPHFCGVFYGSISTSHIATP